MLFEEACRRFILPSLENVDPYLLSVANMLVKFFSHTKKPQIHSVACAPSWA